MASETFVLKGCWKRKEVVHPIADKEIVIQLANTHPWTVNSTPSLKLEYTRIYGQVESDVLMVKGKPNMVEAFEEKWVQGGSRVPADPRRVTAPADSNDVVAPFGIIRVPGGVPVDPNAPMDLSTDAPDLEALIDKVMVSVLKRSGLWKETQQ